MAFVTLFYLAITVNSYPNTLINDHETTTALVSDGIERYQTNKQDIYDKSCFLFAFFK